MISRLRKSFNQATETAFVPPFYSSLTRLLVAIAASSPIPGMTGEIAGLPANTPPIIEAPMEFSFSNDFLGRGGGSDDFRTQQFIIGGTIKDRWDVTVDHSILTLIDGDDAGRTDQVSATLGYRIVNSATSEFVNRLTVGGGVRAYGDFGGERMQNGFHQLVQSGTEQVPYIDLERTDGVVLVDAQRYALLKGSHGSEDWRWGYWVRGSALWASDGQVDGALGAYAVGGRKAVDFWFGLRQDWRSGYEEPVLRETAASEQELAAVIGLRWGPIVFETVQQFDGDGSYGQLRLLAAGFGANRTTSPRSRLEFDAGIMVPDVHVTLAARWRAEWLNRPDGRWQRSMFVMTSFGEPQHSDDPTVYSRNLQLGTGVEWERRLEAANGWASLYTSLGAGWREERVFGDDVRQGQRSETVAGGVALGSVGLRFNAAELFSDYNFRIQLGLTGWAPFSEEQVTMGGDTFRVHEPRIAVALGFTLGRFAAD
jgi:hypothetical protein